MFFFSFFFTLIITSVSAGDRCEPSFADTCFSAVQSDLANILDSDNSEPRNITDNFLESLCKSIDDALNCTTDIIDEDCSVEEGRKRFDKWNMALVNTYYELCDYEGKDDKILLRSILYDVHCWNATHFVECMESNAQLSSIGRLMHIDINKNECDILYEAFEECRKRQIELTKYFCTPNETRSAVTLVHQLLDIFMDSSHCIHYYYHKTIQLNDNKETKSYIKSVDKESVTNN